MTFWGIAHPELDSGQHDDAIGLPGILSFNQTLYATRLP